MWLFFIHFLHCGVITSLCYYNTTIFFISFTDSGHLFSGLGVRGAGERESALLTHSCIRTGISLKEGVPTLVWSEPPGVLVKTQVAGPHLQLWFGDLEWVPWTCVSNHSQVTLLRVQGSGFETRCSSLGVCLRAGITASLIHRDSSAAFCHQTDPSSAGAETSCLQWRYSRATQRPCLYLALPFQCQSSDTDPCRT